MDTFNAIDKPAFVPPSVVRSGAARFWKEWMINDVKCSLAAMAGCDNRFLTINQRAMLSMFVQRGRPWLHNMVNDCGLKDFMIFDDTEACFEYLMYSSGDCKTIIYIPPGTTGRMFVMRYSGMPTMCGGAILWVDTLVNFTSTTAGRRTTGLYNYIVEPEGRGVCYSTRNETDPSSYATVRLAGWKGQIAVVFNDTMLSFDIKRVLTNIRDAMKKCNGKYAGGIKPHIYPVRTTFKNVNASLFLISTEYNRPSPSRSQENYKPGRLLAKLGSTRGFINNTTNKVSKTPSMKYGIVRTSRYDQAIATLTHFGVAVLPSNTTKKTFIRKCLKNQLRDIICSVDMKAHPVLSSCVLLTDNVRRSPSSNGYATDIKTCDVIAFLKDDAELLKLEDDVREIAITKGIFVHSKPSRVLKFVSFDATNNPNEGAHHTVGGVLDMQFGSKGEYMTIAIEDINYEAPK